MFPYNYRLFNPEGQPPHKGQPLKGQQIQNLKHQVVINTVHTWRTGWIEEQRGFHTPVASKIPMLPCLTYFCLQRPLHELNCSPESEKRHHQRQCYNVFLPLSYVISPEAPTECCTGIPNSRQAPPSPNPYLRSHYVHWKITRTLEKQATMGKDWFSR